MKSLVAALLAQLWIRIGSESSDPHHFTGSGWVPTYLFQALIFFYLFPENFNMPSKIKRKNIVNWHYCEKKYPVKYFLAGLSKRSKNKEFVPNNDTGKNETGSVSFCARSVSQRYGSGSFHHQAKIVRKTLISTAL